MSSFSIWHWLILILLIAFIVAIVRFANGRSSRRQTTEGGPIGIGGWLILPIIGFLGVIILTTVNLVQAFSEIEGIRLLLSGATEEAKDIRVPVLLSIGFGLAVISSASICLYKIVFSHIALRSIAILHYCLLATAGLIEFWAEGAIIAVFPDSPRDPLIARGAVQGVFAAMLWIPYFLMSKRVENTFERKTLTAQRAGDQGASG